MASAYMVRKWGGGETEIFANHSVFFQNRFLIIFLSLSNCKFLYKFLKITIVFNRDSKTEHSSRVKYEKKSIKKEKNFDSNRFVQ